LYFALPALLFFFVIPIVPTTRTFLFSRRITGSPVFLFGCSFLCEVVGGSQLPSNFQLSVFAPWLTQDPPAIAVTSSFPPSHHGLENGLNFFPAIWESNVLMKSSRTRAFFVPFFLSRRDLGFFSEHLGYSESPLAGRLESLPDHCSLFSRQDPV